LHKGGVSLAECGQGGESVLSYATW